MILKETKSIFIKGGVRVNLRSPVLSDAGAYIDFATEVFSTSEFIVTQIDEYEPSIEKQKDFIKSFKQSPNSINIIVELDGRIIGNIGFRGHKQKRLSHRGEFGMSVVPKWQGKGLGEALLGALIEWAKDDGNLIEKIELKVAEKNTPAFNLYKKMGFQVEGKILNELKVSDYEYLDTYMMGLWVGRKKFI